LSSGVAAVAAALAVQALAGRARAQQSVEVEAVATTSSATFTDAAVLTFSPPASGGWLIVASALFRSDGADSALVDLTIDGTERSLSRQRSVGTDDWATFAAHRVESLSAGSHTVKIRYRLQNGTAGASAQIRSARIVAIPAGSSYLTNRGGGNVTSSTSFVTVATATMTVTPGAPYLLLAGAAAGELSTTDSAEVRVLQDGVTDLGTAQYQPSFYDAVAGANFRSFAAARVVTLATGVTTSFKLQFRSTSAAASAKLNDWGLTLVKLSSLVAAGGNYANTTDDTATTSTSATDTTKLTASLTPARQYKYWAVGSALAQGAAAAAVRSHLLADGADQGEGVFLPAPGAASNFVSLFSQRVLAWDMSPHAATLAFRSAAAGSTVALKNASLVLIPLEACSGLGDGAACSTGVQCLSGSVCSAQRCTGGAAAPDNSPCSDGNLCTTGDTCHAGTCAGTVATCAASDQCHLPGVCDATTGACSNPPEPGRDRMLGRQRVHDG
jgi:hypothetical protein